jgi:hypothetical protein
LHPLLHIILRHVALSLPVSGYKFRNCCTALYRN